jgi:hypothetical protein
MGIEEDLIQLLDKHDSESLKEILKSHRPHRTVAPEKNIIVYEQKSRVAENIIYIMLIFVMIAVGVAFYLYIQVDKKNNLNEPVYATYEDKQITFDDLPQEEKDMYIHKSIVDKQLKDKQILAQKLSLLADKKISFTNLSKQEQDKYISKEVVDEQFALLKQQYEQDIKDVQKLVEQNNQEIQTNTKYEIPYSYIFDEEVIKKPSRKADATLKCYDMNAAQTGLSKECKENIKTFLDEHKNAKLITVYGVIGQEDKDAIAQNKYKDFTILGLAQSRANETAWYIKKVSKNNTPIQAVSYALESKKVSKGIMIRVYE